MRNLLADILESQYIVNASTFRELWDDTVVDMCGIWVSIFLYAFYLNLFFVAIYTLARRNTAGKKVLLDFTWATVVLATTQMALRLSTSVTNVRTLLQFIEQKPIERSIGASETLRLAQGMIFAINNFVTDTLLLNRCYMIWGSRWKIIVIPGILVVSTLVIGCFSTARFSFSLDPFGRVPYIMATATNLVLVLLTAGHIWWIRRDILHIDINDKIKNCYSKVIAMILKSGALYCIGAILLASTTQLGIVYVVLDATAMYLVNVDYRTRVLRSSYSANATHQSMILSARPSVQQSSKLPSWHVLNVKSSSDEKLQDQLQEEM
ncbi:hypothetical protein B0H19DRAFT_195616 [Mycena capillaripes]|nr:hypothetical protein B0H19DRAFT_195616 [Mycena capillaripes]